MAAASRAELRLPVDLVIGERFDAAAESRELDGIEVPEGWMGLDIGLRTASGYADAWRQYVTWYMAGQVYVCLPDRVMQDSGISMGPAPRGR